MESGRSKSDVGGKVTYGTKKSVAVVVNVVSCVQAGGELARGGE